MLITFSGLDGAGKSTLIQGLKSALEKQNFPVTVLTMYDHVGIYAWIRFIRDRLKTMIGRRLWQSVQRECTLNDPDRFGIDVTKRGWPITMIFSVVRSIPVKRCVYIFDLFIFSLYYLYLDKVKNHTLIIDRYFYDSLADVCNKPRWLYVQFFLLITPVPDLPIFIDVSPEEAFQRKGEYPVEYMKKRRAVYKAIFGLVRCPIVLINKDLKATLRDLEAIVAKRMTGP